MDMRKCSSVYSERGAPLPVLTSGRRLLLLYSAMRPQHLCTGLLPQLKPLRQQGRFLLTHRGERDA